MGRSYPFLNNERVSPGLAATVELRARYSLATAPWKQHELGCNGQGSREKLVLW